MGNKKVQYTNGYDGLLSIKSMVDNASAPYTERDLS